MSEMAAFFVGIKEVRLKRKILYLFVVSTFICLFLEASDDNYEPNDTLATAYIGLPPATLLSSIDGLGVQADDDWYRIDVVAGYERVKITCTFTHDDGDIDIVLYNAATNVMGFDAMSSTDNEYIDFTVPSAGYYYIKVWRRFPDDPDNSYDLWWNGLPTGEDTYESNDTRQTAYTGLPKATWLSSVDGLGFQRDDDFYRINVPDAGYRRVKVECTFTHSEGDIDIVLYDASGAKLDYEYTKTDNESIDFTVPSTGYYYVKVCYDNKGNAYDLWWDTLLADSPMLSSIAITGAAALDENTVALYTCTATWSDSTTSEVTGTASWTENSAYATISSSGALTTGSVSSDQSVTITAVYGGLNTAEAVTIKDIPPTVVSLVITGPASVNENTSVSYTCTATWSDSSTSDVTGTASWSENSAYATIGSNGALTTESVFSNQLVTVSAFYGGSSVNKTITIVFTDTPAPYTEWTILEGIPVDQREHGDTPVNDGVPNLLKYVCGLSAMQQCNTSDLMTIATDSGSSRFAINFFCLKSAVDVDLEAVWAPSLDGPWSTTGVIDEITGEDDEYQYWRGTIPLGESGFMRLRATPVEVLE